ncbi:MAG: hypothetical protein ABIJ42_03785 [Acidobacteriota bacterium]
MNQRKPSYVPAALAGGLFLGIFSGIPILNCLNCACCLMVIGGGLLSSFIYLRSYPLSLPQVTYGDGTVLGVLTGLIGTVFWAFIHVSIMFLKSLMGINIAGMESLRGALSTPGVPPEVRELLEKIFENYLFSDSLTPFLLIFSVVMIAVISVLFATIGSIIGVALFQKKQPLEN